MRSRSGPFGASLVPIVAVDLDGTLVLACGHRKAPPNTRARPRRTQCRACFPDAPLPQGWWAERARQAAAASAEEVP